MKMARRMLLLIVSFAICFALPFARAEGAFSDDPDRIESAVKSVLVLERFDASGESIGTASGFVAFNNKTLVTSTAAIAGAARIVAHSDDGYQYMVDKLLIADETLGVAILGFFSPTDLVPFPLNGENEFKRMQAVVAIGSPAGLTSTVAVGKVSAIYEEAGAQLIQFIAPIGAGTGGALFDQSGAIVGLTVQTQSDTQNVNVAVSVGDLIDLYARWDGTTTAEIAPASTPEMILEWTATPTEEPTATPTAAPTPEPTRAVVLADARLVWCEAGWNIEDPEAIKSEFTQIYVDDLIGVLDFYTFLTFTIDGSAPGFTDAVLTFQLYDAASLLDEMSAETSFGQSETQAQRYFDITGLIRGIPGAGNYALAYLVDGVEMGRSSFYVEQEVYVEPTPIPQTYAALTRGDSGEAVARLQRALIALGYLNDKADGVFGANTGAAVADFNLANGICFELYADDDSYFDRDPQVAWNETLQLLYDGAPLPYVEPYIPLDFAVGAYAQWTYLDSNELQIHFEMENIGKYSTIESYTLFVYATDYDDNLIYGTDQVYQLTTWKTMKPGAVAYSDYITIPYLNEIYEVHCGIAGVTFQNGESAWLDNSEIDYWYWTIDYYD